MTGRRASTERTRSRILEASRRLLERSPTPAASDIAAAAGVSRSTLYRHFPDRDSLLEAVRQYRPPATVEAADQPLPAGRLGRESPVLLDGIHVFDVVAPSLLPDQLVAEAQRIAEVPLALYVVDIDGSHLLRVAGPDRLPERIEVPLAIGPELDSAGLAELRAGLAHRRGVEVVPLWLRGRATGVMLTLGRPRRPLAEIARQAAAAITLADRYTDTFARAQRRKQPAAAAEIQQSLLPPRISRISGGELAGNVLPSYEVAGDWFDFVENLDGVWITLADGLGPSTRAAASSAVALGALRASRRSGGTHPRGADAHAPDAARDARPVSGDDRDRRSLGSRHVQARDRQLRARHADRDPRRPLGRTARHADQARARRPREPATLRAGDDPRAGRPADHLLRRRDHRRRRTSRPRLRRGRQAALLSEDGSAADTVRKVHRAVLDASAEELKDDATVVCLAAE